MSINGVKSHPYIPNSAPETEKEMLDYLGLTSLEELHTGIPETLRLRENMNLPEAFESEYALRRHIEGILKKNESCQENTCYLGAGCYPHYVPAICDEINSRSEFLTAYAGEPYNDHGRFQSLFEYQSLMAELLDMEVVNVPAMDGMQAAATALRMAARVTGRTHILLPEAMDSDKKKVIYNYCSADLTFEEIPFDAATGTLKTEFLAEKLNADTAALYFDYPGYLGMLENDPAALSKAAHDAGALCVVSVNPILLGVLEPPCHFGADIVCGDLQPLGMHMNYGGGQAGFIATMDRKELVLEFPSRLFGICPTRKPGEYGFGDVAYERTSFGHLRENAKEYVGTQAALWGITAGVYLAAMGPQGMREIGETIFYHAHYAAQEFSRLPKVKIRFAAPFFEEFVVDFTDTGRTVEEIAEELRRHHIFAGKNLKKEFPALGECALWCVTELHTREDIDCLMQILRDFFAKEGK